VAEKRNRKGGAMGGMIMGIRGLIEKIEIEKEERIVVGRVRRRRERWRIVVGVYVNKK
jgi:hypothetical protein